MDLALSSREFWELTPREYFALLDRTTQARDRADLRAGVVAAAVTNAMGGLDGEAVGPEYFFPWLRGEDPTEGNAEAMAATLEAFAFYHNLLIAGETGPSDETAA